MSPENMSELDKAMFIVVRQNFGDPADQPLRQANLGLFKDGSALIWNSDGVQTKDSNKASVPRTPSPLYRFRPNC